MTAAPAASEQIQVTVSPARLQLALGEQASIGVAILNRSGVVDQFELQVEGLDRSWYTEEESRVSLFPGDEGRLDLRIHLPADRRVAAGQRLVRLRVFSGRDPRRAVAYDLPLEVLPVGGLEMSLLPRLVTTRGSGHFRIALTNVGNAEQLVDLAVTDPEEALDARLELDRLAVAPDATEEVQLRIAPRRPMLVAPPVHYPFTATALPAGVEVAEPLATAEATLVYRAPLTFLAGLVPRLVSLARALVVLTVIAALVVWVAGTPALPAPAIEVRPTRTPIVIAQLLAAAAAQAPAGGAETPPAEPVAGQRPGAQPTAGPGGERGAPGGAAGAQADATPEPGEQAPRIAVFELSLPPDARPGELDLTWAVEDAEEVTIAATPQPASGALRLPNAQDGEIELVARNAFGETRRAIGIVLLGEPEIVEFRASAENVGPGQAVELVWRVRRAERAALYGPGLHPDGQAVSPGSGRLEVRLDRETTFRLVVENTLGRVERRLVVQVSTGTPPATPPATPQPTAPATLAPAPAALPTGPPATMISPSAVGEDLQIDSFGLAPGARALPGSLPLQWRVAGATEIRLQQADGRSGRPGPYQALDSTEYILTASSSAGSMVRSFTLYVLRPPSIDAFDADRREIETGDWALLRWRVSGADRVFLDGRPVSAPSEGAEHVRPAATGEYALRAENAVGATTQRLQVVVRPPGGVAPRPRPTPAATDAGTMKVQELVRNPS